MTATPSLRARAVAIWAVGAVLLGAVGVGLPTGYAALLALPERELAVVRLCLGAMVPLALGSLAVRIVLSLRGVAVARPDAQARRRVLELPTRLAGLVLGLAALALAAMTVGLVVVGERAPIVLGLLLCTSVLFALPVVPLYAFARDRLLPLATRLSDESPPEGRRLSLSVQLGYAIVAVAGAALVPAAVLGAAQLDSQAAVDAVTRAQLTAERLVTAAAPLDVAAATQLVTQVRLDGGERTLLVAPSGTLLPEDVAAQISGLPYVEARLAGALQGGTVRVTYAARRLAHAPLLLVTLLLLTLTLLAAAIIARAVAADMRGIARQIDRVARGLDPGSLGGVHTQDVRRVMLAANRLLERIPRLTVESFLAIERATEAQRLKSQFLANMSHDLRSPLNSILGFSELLLRGLEGEIAPGQRVVLTAMHATGQRLLRLLNEILDTAKAESGRMELHRQQTAPAELLRSATAEARRGRPAAAADQLSVELQPGLRPILVDPLRLAQAVTHLTNYAFDNADGGPVVLRASEADGGRSLALDVEHAGRLTPAQQASLFDGFHRLAGRPGLHLALPLAKRLIDLHGGTIELAPAGTPDHTRLRAVVPVTRR